MANSISSVNEVKVITNIVHEPALRKAQLRALKIFADAVLCTYGPMGSHTIYSQGTPKQPQAMVSNITKDGFTVLKHINVDKPIESFLKDNIRDICVSVIKTIGDGTSAAVMLSYYIFEGLLTLSRETNIPKRLIISLFKEILNEVSTKIEESKRETTLQDIYDIAVTALNGNHEYAQMIHDIYEQSGMNVFIDVALSNDSQSRSVTYNGMTYNVGYISPAFINNDANNCILPNPQIFVFESPVDTPEMTAILQMIINKNIEEPMREYQKSKAALKPMVGFKKPIPTVIIAPHISRDMNSYLDQLINAFSAVPVIQRLPLVIISGINNNNQYLLDIMSLTGAKFIKKYIDREAYEHDKEADLAPTSKNINTFAGTAEKVIVDALSTRIINPDKMYDENHEPTEFYKNYIAQLEDLLHKYEETRQETVKIGQLKRRINILKGNMVDFYVGGIGIADRDALKDAIEDAVLNCRSAAAEGVGYGASYEGFKVLNEMSLNLEKEISSMEELLNSDDITEEQKSSREATQFNLLAKKGVLTIILHAYVQLISNIYLPYTNGDQREAIGIALQSLANSDESQRCPFNIWTEKFDGAVKTSIKTEPSILNAISRIISLLFDTNQFLLPTPEFNIYEMSEESSTTEIDTTKSGRSISLAESEPKQNYSVPPSVEEAASSNVDQ